MDELALSEAINAKLASYRIWKLEAEVLRPAASGGDLETRIRSEIRSSKKDDKALICVVMLDCIGKATDGGDPAFKISVHVRGVYDFPRAVAPAFADSAAKYLTQRLFVFAAAQVRSLAPLMGLQGVRGPTDILEPRVSAPKAVANKRALGTTAPTRGRRTTGAKPAARKAEQS